MPHRIATRLFDDHAMARLAELTTPADVPWSGTFEDTAVRAALSDVEVLVTAWGTPPLDERVLAAAPRLRAVLHGGGTIRHFVTDACWERGLVIVSAAEANAIPVAEFTLASIIYAGKRLPTLGREYATTRGGTWFPSDALAAASNLGRVVGLVGLSRVGRRVAALLRPFDFDVLAADPLADAAQARRLGTRLVDLDELLGRADIVSLHAPLLPTTQHMIDARRLALMGDHTALINTARGGLVDTEALTKELVSGRLMAFLDVTDPEPLPPDSPLYDLPNVQLTPHLAGSTGTELTRMGALVVDELARYVAGEGLAHRVTREDMTHVA